MDRRREAVSMSIERRTSRVGRRVAWGVLGALALAMGAFLARVAFAPYRPPQLAFTADPGSWRGVYHVHTRGSDGLGTVADVAAAARAAGAAWVLVADHNHMESPRARYVDGVLMLSSPEVSVPDGHAVAVGASRALSREERRAGDALAAIRRTGGAPVAAHPQARKRPYRRVDDPALAGMEVLSAEQEFRDALVAPRRLVPAALAYLVDPLDGVMRLVRRPDRTLAAWDELLRGHPLAGFCAVDAHGLPSYAVIMRVLQMHAGVGHPPTGDAEADAAALIETLVRGRSYCGIDALGDAGGFRFGAASDAGVAAAGGEIRLDHHPVIHVGLLYDPLPPGARARLICNGVAVPMTDAAAATGRRLEYRPVRPGACRAEVEIDRGDGRVLPWIVSNPIYVR